MKSLVFVILFSLSFVFKFECLRQIKSSAKEYGSLKEFMPLLSNKKKFFSKNGILSIKINPNKSVNFVDVRANTDDVDSKKYLFLGCVDILSSFIVQENGYELSSIIMISKNGNKTNLWSLPYTSRDGRTVVCLSQGIETDLVPNGLQVLQMKNGEVVKSCKTYLNGYEPQNIRWLNNVTFVLKSQGVGSNGLKVNKYKYDKFTVI